MVCWFRKYLLACFTMGIFFLNSQKFLLDGKTISHPTPVRGCENHSPNNFLVTFVLFFFYSCVFCRSQTSYWLPLVLWHWLEITESFHHTIFLRDFNILLIVYGCLRNRRWIMNGVIQKVTLLTTFHDSQTEEMLPSLQREFHWT